MGISLEVEKNEKLLQNSKMRKEKLPSFQANLSLKHQEKCSVRNQVDLPCSGPSHEQKQKTDCGSVNSKSSGNCERHSIIGKAKKNDELIKYMSDVPGYLQRLETGENLKEKVLNVGVLEWSRLEKWNHNQEIAPARGSKNASSVNGDSSQKMSTGSFSLSGPDHCMSPAEHVKPSMRKVTRFQDFETASKSSLDGQKKKPWTYKSFSGNYIDEKSKRKDLDKKINLETGSLSSNLRNQGVPCKLEKSVRARSGTSKRAQGLQKEEFKRNNLDEKISAELRASTSKLRNYGTSLSSEEKISAWNEDKIRAPHEVQKSGIDLAHHHCPGERKNIVLLLPRKYPPISLSVSEVFHLSEIRIAADGELIEADESTFSGCFSPGEVHSTEVPHSCQLPYRVESISGPDMLPHCKINDQGMELVSGASQVTPMLIQGKCAAENKLTVKTRDSNLVESPKVMDQSTNDEAEKEGRSPTATPNRRFRFGLGRLSRSSSLKEGSAVPLLSSTYLSAKSGPVRFEAADCLDISNKEKGHLHNRARSSPLRRLLEPLLKSKVATSLPSAETIWPSKVNLNSSSVRSSNASEYPDNEKPLSSSVQAFLQLTVKNGLPLFRFVADNNKVLAATMRNFATPEKDDSSENFTFYSVNEIKKKSGGWMNQGSKEKKCDYVYNVVGQMKVSSPHSSALSGQTSNWSVIKESVLFGVELHPEEQDSTKSTTHRELAAVVVKIPGGNLNHRAEKDSTDWFPEHRCSFNSEDNEDSASIVAILPGGLHSLPKKGVPSPLIDRWRSGGSCDCGGWDIGCKLCVLSNYDQYNKISRISRTHLIQERFELFVQEGAQQDRPLFSLAPVKNGAYSIAFNASISLLQAFFISVAVLNCQKFPDPLKALHEQTLDGNDGIKTSPGGVQDEVPVRYVPNLPLTPVDRV